jgi:hypothetical protein
MKIGLLVDLEGQRVWHRWLASEVALLGYDFTLIRPLHEMRACPSGLRLALWLDPIWFRLGGGHAFDAIPSTEIAEKWFDAKASDIELDLLIDVSTAHSQRPKAHRTIQLTFNDAPSELAAVGALLDDGAVTFSIECLTNRTRETARPALHRRECLTEGLNCLFSAVVELVAERIGQTSPSPSSGSTGSTPWRTHADKVHRRPTAATSIVGVAHLTKLLTAKLARYLTVRSHEPMHWSIATRVCGDAGLLDAWPCEATYNVIPDDAKRYYADPFLFEHSGRKYLFCEEYPLATGRGLLSVASVDSEGKIGSFQPILERPYHLSYPFVFAYDGQIWMVPEAYESGSVELYRAVEFPNRWTLDRKLLDGIGGCDATIFCSGGIYWMMLTTARYRGSTWDKQRLYWANSPLGPWSEHANGLIRIDSVVARPAGAVVMHNNKILRPAQNCSHRYGGSIVLLEIEELSRAEFRETPVAEVKTMQSDGLLGTHTYSRSGTIEAVDVWGALTNGHSAKLICTPVVDAAPISTVMPNDHPPAGTH